MRRSLPLVVLVLVLVFAAASQGNQFAQPFAWYIVGTHRQDVQVTVPSAEASTVAGRFSLACSFMAAAAAMAAAVTRPGASAASLVTRTLLFLLVAGLAFGCAAVFYRYQFSAFVLEAGETEKLHRTLPRAYRTTLVTLADVPAVRVPVIAGLCTLVAGALTRAVAMRLGGRAPSPTPAGPAASRRPGSRW